MNEETQEYIHNVKVRDIPWHRITTIPIKLFSFANLSSKN